MATPHNSLQRHRGIFRHCAFVAKALKYIKYSRIFTLHDVGQILLVLSMRFMRCYLITAIGVLEIGRYAQYTPEVLFAGDLRAKKCRHRFFIIYPLLMRNKFQTANVQLIPRG